jgi:hypothetical protein
MRRTNHRRGLTLLELMVGVFIALFLTTAAVVFARHETRLLGYSNEQVDMQHQSRAAIDTLTLDLQSAGGGVGYAANGNYLGLRMGPFTVPGGAGFNQNGGVTTLTLRQADDGGGEAGAAYAAPTRDLAILFADIGHVTVANYEAGGTGELCDRTNRLPDGEDILSVIRDASRLTGRSVIMRITGNAGVCTYGQCAPIVGNLGSGCRTFTWTDDPENIFPDDVAATTVNYTGGQLAIGLKEIVWFVNNERPPYDHLADLRRVVFDGTTDCNDRATCGSEQAFQVETLQWQLWAFSADPTGANPGRWAVVPDDDGDGFPGPAFRDSDNNGVADEPATDARMRIDVEFVVRERNSDQRPHAAVQLKLNPGNCIPGGGTCVNDRVLRRAHRFSVEIRNSGRT